MNKLRLLFLTFLVHSLVGCASAQMRREISSALLANNEILVEMHEYTYVMPMYSHMGEIHNSHYHLFRFPLDLNSSGLRPSAVALLPHPIGLESSYSANRIVVALHPPDSNKGEWRLEVWQWNQKQEIQIVNSWNSPGAETAFPPFAISNDGRYVSLLLLDGKTFDTSTLRPVEVPKIAKMFESAKQIGIRRDQSLRLTQKLGYLVFKPAAQNANGNKIVLIAGKPISRKWYSLFVSRVTGKVGAFPDKLNYEDVTALPIFYQDAAESEDGQLLLQYGQYQPSSKEILYTIRDESLAILHKVAIPVSEGAPGRSWDPANHRMLFYSATNRIGGGHLQKFTIWDYVDDTFGTVWVDLDESFETDK